MLHLYIYFVKYWNSDFRPQEETRKPSAATKAKGEEWRSCQKTASWDTVYQGSKGVLINIVVIIIIIIYFFTFNIHIWNLCSYTLQVQLQHKIKQEAEQFRQWKASREKELLQVVCLFFFKMFIIIVFSSLKSQRHCNFPYCTFNLEWMILSFKVYILSFKALEFLYFFMHQLFSFSFVIHTWLDLLFYYKTFLHGYWTIEIL